MGVDESGVCRGPLTSEPLAAAGAGAEPAATTAESLAASAITGSPAASAASTPAAATDGGATAAAATSVATTSTRELSQHWRMGARWQHHGHHRRSLRHRRIRR